MRDTPRADTHQGVQNAITRIDDTTSHAQGAVSTMKMNDDDIDTVEKASTHQYLDHQDIICDLRSSAAHILPAFRDCVVTFFKVYFLSFDFFMRYPISKALGLDGWTDGY